MGAWERLRDWRWRLAGHGRPLGAEFTEPLHRATLLEVGGPSAVFTDAGLLPAYALAAAVHGLQWSTDTVWHGRQDPGDYAPAGVPLGRMLVSDDPDLAQVADGSYDGVISSHVIEHLANPLRALATWRRITRAGGLVLLIAPPQGGHVRSPSTGHVARARHLRPPQRHGRRRLGPGSAETVLVSALLVAALSVSDAGASGTVRDFEGPA